MIQRLFTWWVSTRRPTTMTFRSLVWLIVDLSTFRVWLAIMLQNSESQPKLVDRQTWICVVRGELLLHLRHDGKDHPRHMYAYDDLNLGAMRVLHLLAGDQVHLECGDCVMTELLDAVTEEDRILDFPRWMSVNEVKRHAQRQAWLIVIAAGGNAREI